MLIEGCSKVNPACVRACLLACVRVCVYVRARTCFVCVLNFFSLGDSAHTLPAVKLGSAPEGEAARM